MSLLHKFVFCFFAQTVLCNLVFKAIYFDHSILPMFLSSFSTFCSLSFQSENYCQNVSLLGAYYSPWEHVSVSSYIKLAWHYDELRLPSEASLFHTPGSLETFPVKIMTSLTPVPVQLLQNSAKQQHGSQCLGCTHTHEHTHKHTACSCNAFPGSN